MFWTGFIIGMGVGVLGTAALLMFFMGASERMTAEEWECQRKRERERFKSILP